MILVFGVLLILFEWYWYVVCESGIRTSLILAQGNRWKCTAKAKHDWRSYVFRSQHVRRDSPRRILLKRRAAQRSRRASWQPHHDGASSTLAQATCCVAWKVGSYPRGADRRIVMGPHSFSTLGRRTSEQRRHAGCPVDCSAARRVAHPG